jgi:predicted flap endonuclease-1-like 5' DNA nuclease/predicted  nucleic acid-binding Zn-ribbon protein
LGYLIFQILFFLLIAALLGFVIGWLWRGSRFQSELQDLDARWRAKLADVEKERDRFASEVSQAKEAKAKFEVSAAESQRLADTHEASLRQLRTDHEAKLGFLSDVEKRVGSLEADLSSRDQELAAAKEALAKQGGASGDSGKLTADLAAANSRAAALERDLQQAEQANNACKKRVEGLEAEIAALRRGSGSTGSAVGSDAGSEGSSGATSGGGGSTQLGFMGSAGTTAASDSGTGAAGSTGGGAQASTGGAGSSDGGSESEGTRPQALTSPQGGTADDLKKISGVGPKLEKTLNGLGIFHFHQIAAFTRENVAWVDKYLRFKGRIDRENWIEQAKILADGGETEFSRRN